MKLSICLIVKNEAAMLPHCLESVKAADEIIVCDTGSTDNTIEIALQFTDKVFTDYMWNDNFPEARNYAKSKATGDWILSIDADETLQPHGIKIIKNFLSQHANNQSAFYVQMIDAKSFHKHQLIRLFRNVPSVFWEVNGGGYVHETINTPGPASPVKIIYDFSPAHAFDPAIDLRLLKKSIIDFPDNPRNYYYLAREYFYNQLFFEAIQTIDKYVLLSTFQAEIADAWLMKARCLWLMHQGDKARQSCLNAITINPDFKEAILFMAEMSWADNAEVWQRFAKTCKNSNVLFIRTNAE